MEMPMNEKQAKLLRYFVKNTGQLKMATAFKIGWPTLNHKKKGKLTRWLKNATVTAMEMKKLHKQAQTQANLDTLKSFTGETV
jgi:hypothetical protein